jgi:hypothetical protein
VPTEVATERTWFPCGFSSPDDISSNGAALCKLGRKASEEIAAERVCGSFRLYDLEEGKSIFADVHGTVASNIFKGGSIMVWSIVLVTWVAWRSAASICPPVEARRQF